MKKIVLAATAVLALTGATLGLTQSAQAASCVVVKNVVGKNYQTAQDSGVHRALLYFQQLTVRVTEDLPGSIATGKSLGSLLKLEHV